jgi:hypothetical protein
LSIALSEGDRTIREELINEKVTITDSLYKKVTTTITPSKSGVLRLGLTGFNHSIKENSFHIANIIVKDQSASTPPIYMYKSSGLNVHSETLYRITDVPCDCTSATVSSMFENKYINTTLGSFKITKSMIRSGGEDTNPGWYDTVGNYMIIAPHPTSN